MLMELPEFLVTERVQRFCLNAPFSWADVVNDRIVVARMKEEPERELQRCPQQNKSSCLFGSHHRPLCIDASNAMFANQNNDLRHQNDPSKRPTKRDPQPLKMFYLLAVPTPVTILLGILKLVKERLGSTNFVHLTT